MSDAGVATVSMMPGDQDPFLRAFSFKGRAAPGFSKHRSFEEHVSAGIVSFLGILGVFVSIPAIAVFGFWAVPLLVASLVPGIWISSAYLVRRGHDLGWSAVWVLVPMYAANLLMLSLIWFAIKGMLIAIVLILGGLMTFGMCAAGFVYSAPGTPGPNRFGPDPRETK